MSIHPQPTQQRPNNATPTRGTTPRSGRIGHGFPTPHTYALNEDGHARPNSGHRVSPLPATTYTYQHHPQ
eukprot:4089651-Karenia_brevis.AAC.1